ncbi:MAG: phosphatidylcholine/phosphatidylserine synthase [Rhizobiaceae bacterium]|jgi:CDP-diacylglycerol--serine O-phosphatidyltransferase|nr:phosphatidylcholine/phosphatidylserine synthase [Rhizobiaceae bacterium]
MDSPFAPFDPDGDEGESAQNGNARGARLREVPLRKLIPNLITVLAVCAGITGIRLAYEGRFELAVAMVLLAAFLDGIDGRIARLIKGETRFGAEMDSLADIVNFGVAPALVLHAFVLHEVKTFGWVAALAYVVACALRLARFNVLNIGVKDTSWRRDYFVGVPAPMGAGLVFLPFYLGQFGLAESFGFAVFSTVYTGLVAFLMISRLPVWSGKSYRFPREYAVLAIMGAVVFAGLVASEPWLMLSLCVLAYLAFLPFSARAYLRRERAEQVTPASGNP